LVHKNVTPDGKRFVKFPRPDTDAEGKGNLHVTFLLKLFDESRRQIPEGK